MQAEPGQFHHLGESVIFFPGQNGLQREHLAPLLRTGGYPVADRATQHLPQRVFVALFQGQVTVFLIPLKNSLSLQKSGNSVANRMHQFRQFLLIRCVGAMKSAIAPGRGGASPVHKQHVKGHRAAFGSRFSVLPNLWISVTAPDCAVLRVKHLSSDIGFIQVSDEVNASIQIENAIADLKKVKKKKSRMKKLIGELETLL